MNTADNVNRSARAYRQRKSRRRIWRNCVSVMACIVVFCVTYALILPAITMEKETFCGIEVHVHDESCYGSNKVVACDPAGESGLPVIHAHDAMCYDGENLICKLPELSGHVHTDSCYETVTLEAHTHDESCNGLVRGALTCTVPEEEGHAHGDGCYTPGEKLLCTETEREGHTHTDACYVVESVLSCTTAEGEGHTHGDSCYAKGSKLTCTIAEGEGHTHGDSCKDAEGNLICTVAEAPAHTHGDGCYTETKKLICTVAEAPAHTHGDGCYTEKKTLTCTVAEDPGHTHSGTCYEQVLSCRLPEKEGHAHSDACYEMVTAVICGKEERAEAVTNTNLVCTQKQIAPHTHNSGCKDENGNLICTIENAAVHQHTEECFKTSESEENLICEVEIHEHTLSCYANPEADVETAEDWIKTFAHVKLTGNWSEDVIAIAKTQLGYNESTKNYIVDESGETKGYTRYGAWYGAPYGDWCAMFASFCYRYAGVEGVPLDASCPNWISSLDYLGLYNTSAEYIPNPGDLIFFDWNANGAADHVGLVAEADEDNIRTIEGNSGDTVAYHDYAIDDDRILGYGTLPVQEEEEVNPYLCGLQEHIHTEECYDVEGNMVCGMEEHTHTDDCLGKKLVYTDHMIRAFVTIKGVTELPEDLSVQVWEITAEDDPATFESMRSALVDQMASKSQFVSGAGFYGMELLSEGSPYVLPETAEVTVDVEFVQPLFTAEEVENAAEIKTFMLTEQEQTVPVEQPEAAAEETTEEAIGIMRLFSLSADEEEPEAPAVYDAQAISGEDYEQTKLGLTSVSFQTSRIAAFAVARATTVQKGTFWTRVTKTSELTADGTYLIISAEGNYALTGDSDANCQPVVLRTVKGNTDYFYFTDAAGESITGTDSNLCWTFTQSGNKYEIVNQGGDNNYLNLGDESFISGTEGNNTVQYYSPENCWRIYNGDYYLRNEGAGAAFTRALTSRYNNDGSGTGSYSSTQTFYFTRDMLIFKLSDTTSLEVPKDVADKMVDDEGTVSGPPKPDYDPLINPSGAKEEATFVENEDVKVKGQAWSDPATSQLEANFQKNSFEASKAIDGKVMSDKSVIYMDDDYDAFESYDPNTFAVTLSALGQEYPVFFSESVKTPLDVVFVLDVSGSMTTNNTKDDITRMQALSAAFNEACTNILEANENNRIGVALFSSGAWEMLPLDRYTATKTNGIMNLTTVSSRKMSYRDPAEFLVGSSSLENEDGKSFANAGLKEENGEDILQSIGTYTQAGIQMGYNILKENEETTYKVKIHEGTDAETAIEIIRQPVIILLSDGEPTHATNNYMDPLSGPHYGDGNGDNNGGNVSGVQGYYTVLSANYFKRMAGIHYGKKALFYTVGLGIKEPDDKNDDKSFSSSQGTGDRYKRAVLNPTPTTVAEATSSITGSPITVANEFIAMMTSQYSAHAIKTRSEWPPDWMGIPHEYTPVLQTNPYAGDYSYADDAFFGRMSKDELTEIFESIITSSTSEIPYGFVLYRNSSVEMMDTIGAGMEVKGIPVLRYGGVNYYIDEDDPKTGSITVKDNVTTYTYKGTFVDSNVVGREADLSRITVTITKNENGTQTVDMFVPDVVLPTYTPELIGKDYYYEALPVRLIYQVGLTAESEAEVLALATTGGEKVYYTNAWENAADQAITYLLPSTENPFYFDIYETGKVPYEEHSEGKSSNTTDTVDFHTKCHWDTNAPQGTYRVIHNLGNNGKLVFSADKPDLEIAVQKEWQGVTANDQNPVTFALYKVTGSGNSAVAQKLQEVELNKDNGWNGKFENLEKPGDDWYYAVGEDVPDGFIPGYSSDTVTARVGTDGNAVYVTVAKVVIENDEAQTVIIKNTPTVVLPETGGMGTGLFYGLGGLLMAAAVLLLILKRRSIA